MAGSGTAHLRDEAILRVHDLVVEFDGPRSSTVHAVSGVSFDLEKGETLGIVGESGCGKTTTGRAVMQLVRPTSGTIELNGHDLTATEGDALRRARRSMQMIFQDPVSSLNPSRRVRDIVREGLEIWGSETERSAERSGDDAESVLEQIEEEIEETLGDGGTIDLPGLGL